VLSKVFACSGSGVPVFVHLRGKQMFAKSKKINRQYFGKEIKDFWEIPDLIDIQTSSYEEFIQKERLDKGEPLLNQGLQEVFTSTFPIEGGPDNNMTLEYDHYEKKKD
jgi:DNA-directed RNA polymerase subunit beta